MAHHLRIANADVVVRQIGDWAETEISRDIERSLQLVRSTYVGVTMIAGSPGTGKTTTVARFCDELGEDALYIQAAEGEGTPWNFAHMLADEIAKSKDEDWGDLSSNYWVEGGEKFASLSEARVGLAHGLGGKLLVIDEAQYLYQRNRKTGKTGEAFEWLRAMAEMGTITLVFCGDLNLPRAIASRPQLQSRLIRPVIVKEVSRADVAALTEGTDFAGSRLTDALYGVAKLRGGLRNVENTMRHAEIFSGGKPVTGEVLHAAIVDMKLGKRGAFTG